MPNRKVAVAFHCCAWLVAARGRGRLFGFAHVVDDVDVDARRLDDLIVVSAKVVAVTLEDVGLVPDGVDVGRDGTCDVAGVAPPGDELQRDLLSSAPDPERR